MKYPIVAAFLALGLATPAAAEVKARAADGFVIEHVAEIAAPPAQVYRALGRIGRWWESSHTYSGAAANMTMPLRVGACFCERWDGNEIEHGRVILAWPNRTLRLDAPLGPLQEQAVSSILNFAIAEAPGGSRLTVTMRVNGSSLSGLEAFAAPVDGVIGTQVQRFERFVETGSPDAPAPAR